MRPPRGWGFGRVRVGQRLINKSVWPSEQRVRAIVREETVRTGRTLVGTAVWTLLSVLAALVGLRSFQFARLTPSVAVTAGFVLAGAAVTGASLYLLYLLHRA